mmetsp:Transcript_72490/g.65184  ORF Transcript_72490/g.65184 Transcript_72490/m.65184 type:complete len:81 (-) Transcript_72490:22-264(-)
MTDCRDLSFLINFDSLNLTRYASDSASYRNDDALSVTNISFGFGTVILSITNYILIYFQGNGVYGVSLFNKKGWFKGLGG